VQGDLGEVTADVATPLAVVLAEVLQNAVEHAFVERDGSRAPVPPDVGHVVVALAHGQKSLIVKVSDDGIGLPQDFDIERTTSLGLSIVRDLVVSQLNGSISMTPRPETGDGSEVSIEVPLR
jgi:two-component sensor histidine kinase